MAKQKRYLGFNLKVMKEQGMLRSEGHTPITIGMTGAMVLRQLSI